MYQLMGFRWMIWRFLQQAELQKSIQSIKYYKVNTIKNVELYLQE